MNGLTLLLVDDDAAYRSRLAAALRVRGYEVTVAANAAEAFVAVGNGGFDRAVVDLRLGAGPNGLEVLRRLREIRPDVRAVMLTGYGSIATAVHAIRVGAADYLSKPADADQIQAALEAPGAPPVPAGEPVPSLERVEWEHLQRVLASCGGNISQTARVLGIERRSLQRRLQKIPPSR